VKEEVSKNTIQPPLLVVFLTFMNNFKREKSDFPKTTLFVLKKNSAIYPT